MPIFSSIAANVGALADSIEAIKTRALIARAAWFYLSFNTAMAQ